MQIYTQAVSQSHLLEVIGPVSRGLLSMRGGSAETVDSVYIRSAVGYFNNLRVPAAVLMSIIMKEMFTLQSKPTASMRKWDVENGVAHSKRWRILRYSYILLMVLAFSLETFTIFVATQVLTELATATAQRMVPLVPTQVICEIFVLWPYANVALYRLGTDAIDQVIYQ